MVAGCWSEEIGDTLLVTGSNWALVRTAISRNEPLIGVCLSSMYYPFLEAERARFFSRLLEKNRLRGLFPVSDALGENTLIPLYRLCRSKARLFFAGATDPSVSLLFTLV